jgi:F420-non-reducing hydrogenase iron-sulfur subunit
MREIGAETAPPANRSVRTAPSPGSAKTPNGRDGDPVAVAFICENCARAGATPSSGMRRRPVTPDFAWPFAIEEIVVPCAGRLQPEHVLKAIEDGADAVAVICCEDGNCHHLEGNRRCARRLDYVGKLIDDIGLGPERLAIFHLPGSAAEDMALGISPGTTIAPDPRLGQKIAEACQNVRQAFVARLQSIPRNPLRTQSFAHIPSVTPEMDDSDESDE